MAVDPRKRQKQLARKKAKHKANVAAKRVRKDTLEARGFRTAPIRDCLVADNIEQSGMGSVVISRNLPDGRVAFANFLLDIYCLGAKDAMHLITTPSHYDELVQKTSNQCSYERIDPPSARKLVEGAVAYARSFGLEPHPDYFPASAILGDIDPDQAQREFTYGRDGKPCFISGPFDSPERIRQIMQAISTAPTQLEHNPER